MNFLKRNFDFFVLALILAGFVFVAAQKLGQAPLPDSDEAMTLQVPYEMLYRGKLAFPMYRFLGGNIENTWHSYTPVYFVALSTFMKVFGWGLIQGRAFNLITAVLLLVMTYLIARRLFGWLAGLISVVLIVSDPVFLARSRLARNDLLAVAFGLLAFYLYEQAAERRVKWLYLASGLAAGAGVMCHTNMLCILCAVAVLMLLRDGWKILKTSKPFLLTGGALLVMAYEIIYDIVDHKNFILQNRKDDIHFRVLQLWGWLNNLSAEPTRYVQWFEARGAKIAAEILLLQVFLILTVIAILYLLVLLLIQIRRRQVMNEPRMRVLIATLVIALFFAVVTQRKVIQYVVYLSPWFALCVSVLLTDSVRQIGRLRRTQVRWARAAYALVAAIAVLVVTTYGYELAKQNRDYLRQIRNPDQASFEDLTSAVRSIVPAGLCPISIASAYYWLAFPEYDQCYLAHMEARLDEHLDLEGKEYALIVKPKFEYRLKKLTGGGFEQYHLLGELKRTAYGSFYVYYTGTDPRILSRTAKRYCFFGRQRGYVSDDQIASGREVWTASAADLTPTATSINPVIEADDPDEPPEEGSRGRVLELCAVELEANTIYQVSADAANSGRQEILVLDASTGAVIQRVQSSEQEETRSLEGLFKTSSGTRVRLAVRLSGARPADPSPVSRISIRKIASI